MNNLTLSIVVTCYNRECYIEGCVSSILSQLTTVIKLIEVNDGISDSSLDILEQIKLKDNRLQIVTPQNNGVSAARNKGILLIKSEYI